MKKIMIVEDDHAVGQALKSSLERDGYQVIWIEDGDSVIAELDSDLSLIYLDILLPGMLDGFKILDMIKAPDSEYREIPVVMMTNESDPAQISKAVSAGATDYLIKSNEKLQDILTLTEKLIGKA